MKIFGTAASKAFRALWMAEEAHIDYVHVPVHPRESKNHPDLLHINPRGTIPALQDGDFYLTESLAITTYIAPIRTRIYTAGVSGGSTFAAMDFICCH